MTGTSARTTLILMIAWNEIQAVIPAASNPPKVSGARMAVRIPAQAKAANSPITTRPPIKPNSWPMTEKTKSLKSFGTRTRSLPRPVPKIPPAASASRPFRVW